ncbi:MAG: hypothetical protein AAF226_15905, partial [Verrucomicrobiota bacterium]
MVPLRLFSKLLLILTTCWLLAPAGHAEVNLFNHTYRVKGNGQTKAKAEAVFGFELKHGMQPFRLHLTNGTAADITWTFSLNNSQYRPSVVYDFTHTVTVPAGEERVEEFYAPVAPEFRNSGYTNHRYTLTAPGLKSLEYNNSSNYDDDFPSIAISEKLAQRNLTALASEADKRGGRNFFGHSFRKLPADWRGLSGLDAIMLDEDAYRSLDKAQKRALITWVRMGGRLDIYTSKESKLADLKL